MERGKQAIVFGVIVGLLAEVLAEGSDFVSSLIGDDDTVARWPRIAPRATIDVSDQVSFGQGPALRGEEIFCTRASSTMAKIGRHWKSLQRSCPSGMRHIEHQLLDFLGDDQHLAQTIALKF